MKVLVATVRGQGQDPDDHCWATEGELVRLVDCPEPGCGYAAFTGLESRQATSTARVAERRDLDPHVLYLAFRRHSELQGEAAGPDDAVMRGQVEAEIAVIVESLQDLAPGEVVGRAGTGVQVRNVMA